MSTRGFNAVRKALGKAGQALHNWELSIVKPPANVSVPDDFVLRFKSAGIPVSETEYAHAELAGFKFIAASKVDRSGEIEGVVYEGIDGVSQDFLKELERNSWSFTEDDMFGNQAAIDEQKMVITLKLLSGLDNEPTRIFTLDGALINLTGRGELGQDLALQELNIKIVYDVYYEKNL